MGGTTTRRSESSPLPDRVQLQTKEKQIPPKDASALPYLLAYFPGLLAIFGALMGGWWTFSTLIFTFGIVPLLDLVIGLDEWNPTKEQEKEMEKRLSFRIITWIWPITQYALLIFGAYFVSTHSLTTIEWIGIISAFGMHGGSGINTAHELIHKPNIFEQTLGKFTLVSVCYGHFYIEHLWGHHKKVSTLGDPATSLYGENFYSFWVRCVRDSFLDAWAIEKNRLSDEKLPVLSLQNQMIHFIVASLGIAFLLLAKFGFNGFVFFWGQSFWAFSLLELVNYIEHYGLMRKKDKAGEYGRVTPGHSWNAGHRITNYFLFKLQRHSDHHAYARRRYQILRSWKTAPQMPTGYAGMILLALFPPLWFKVMNPRVQEVRKMQEDAERQGKELYVDPSMEVKDL